MLVPLLCTAIAGVRFEDTFDDDLGAWTLAFTEADGWEAEVTGGELVVTGFTGTTTATDPDQSVWSVAALSGADLTGLDDFTAGFSVRWDSDGQDAAMQLLVLEIRGEGGRVARVGYHDAWTAWSGQSAVLLDGFDTVQSGYGSLPLAGRGTWHVVREQGVVEVYFDGQLVTSETVTRPLTHLRIEFGFVDFVGSVFGTEALDHVFVLDEADRSVIASPIETGDTGEPPVGPCGQADMGITSFTHDDSGVGPYWRDYDIAFDNAGPQAATGVELVLELPRQVANPELRSGSLLDAGAACALEGSTFTCSWDGPMDVTEMDAVIRVERVAGVPSEATVSVSADPSDTCQTNNRQTEQVVEPVVQGCVLASCGAHETGSQGQCLSCSSTSRRTSLVFGILGLFWIRRRRTTPTG